MTFQEAEHKFRELEKKWKAGLLSLEGYRAVLVNLRVTDAFGQVWMMQEHTGVWFVYSNGQWVLPEQAPAPRAARPAPAPAASPAAAPKRGPGLALILGLVRLCVVVTLVFA
ncbi:MAG TPA: hypothetical protein PJ988_17200, partial [Anaerolinea sp.]|nr:hypothetical protein [Anaerolinea sp.]